MNKIFSSGMAALATIAALCSIAAPARAQVPTTTNAILREQMSTGAVTLSASSTDCTTASSCATAIIAGSASASVNLVFAGTATAQFEGTIDNGTTWVSVKAFPLAGGAAVTSATASGQWQINTSGLRRVRVRLSAFTNNVTAWINASSGPSPSVVSGVTAANLELAQASTTSGQVGPIVQTATTTAAPTYTNAKTNPLNTTTGGALRSDMASVGGTALAFGSAVSASSIPVVIASDQAAVTAKGAAADGAGISGNPVPIAVKGIADGASPTQVTAGQAAYPVATLERIPIVTTRHPNHIQCQVTVSTATTIQAVGGSCATPGPNLSIYITDIDFSTNAAGIAADSFNTLKSGTGGTCGAATAVIWQCMTPAATQATCPAHLTTPIKVAANSEVCWINTTAGSKTLNIEGYIAP